MRFLALDLGTTTGWATFDGFVITSGVQSFAINSRFEGAGMRYLKLTGWLNQMHHLSPFERVAFEEVRQRAASVAAGHMYGGFMATLMTWCEAHKVPYEGVPVGTIKKFWTGAGNASKEAMVAEARKRGHLPKDDNEADALAIIYWLTSHAAPCPPSVRPAPDVQPPGRVPLGAVRLDRRPVSK